MKRFNLFVLLSCAVGTVSVMSHAQEVKRCDGAGGKVTYAEICPPGTASSTVTNKGLSVTESDKNQRATEAAFQKRHAEREKRASSERASTQRAALAQRKANIAEEKMRRELTLKEDAAKRGDRTIKRAKKAKAKKKAANA